jgi:hypothetical protein
MYYRNSFSSETFYGGVMQAMPPVSERYLASWPNEDDALVFTIRDLNQHPARVMSEIENSGNPGFIIRDGRFAAIITPLVPGQVESRVLGEMVREIAQRDRRWAGAAVTADWPCSSGLPAWL